MVQKSLLVIFVLVLSGSTSRAEPPGEEAVKFYQTLKRMPLAMDASGLTFGDKLRAAIALDNTDHIDDVKIAFMDVLLTLHRLKAERTALKVIPSVSGQELYGAMADYLKQREMTILESGTEIIRIAGDGALGADAKKAKIKELINGNHRGAAAVEASLARAFMAFAREHDLVGEPMVELHEFVPPDKSCKVSMPDLTENKTSEADGVKNTYYLAEHKHGVFMLSHADVAASGEDQEALQKRIEDARTGVINKLNLKVTKESSISLAGKYPGRELEGDLADKSFTRIRLFIVNGRLYQLWVVGTPAWAVSTEATRFLGSLELLK